MSQKGVRTGSSASSNMAAGAAVLLWGEIWAQRGEIELQLCAGMCQYMVVLYVSSRDRVTHHAAAG